MTRLNIVQQYRYPCACGCGDVKVTFSRRKALLKGNGEIEQLWAVRDGKRIIADTYTPTDAERVRSALERA